MKAIIDPRIKYNYASYYLLGLFRYIGKDNISYSITPFTGITYLNTRELNCGMAFILYDDNASYKIFIDFEDVAIINRQRYEWADIYAKVNPTEQQVSECCKLIAIGPEFGITLGGYCTSIVKSIINYTRSRKYSHIPYKLYLRDYLYTNIRRRKISAYEIEHEIRPNYIFHASTLWYNRFAATDTNKYRGDFLIACKKAGVTVEGGLFYINGNAPIVEMPDYPQYKEIYKDFIYDKRLSMDDYIRKTKESVLVFNTPSVCECHGWKLAEYLCMGKAIISTPLTRAMPGSGLVHGVNVHFVKNADEIFDAVKKINTDVDYRKKLEHGARAYYEEFMSPQKAIKRIVAKARELQEKNSQCESFKS